MLKKKSVFRNHSIATSLLLSVLFFVLFILFVSCNKNSGTNPTPGDELKNSIFGLFSETFPDSVLPDVNSYIGICTEGSSQATLAAKDFNEKAEGEFSQRISMGVDETAGEFACWFVAWGVEGTSDFVTRDMSGYAEGYLSFWIKSPVNLEVSIRSGDVQAGTETSIVLLSGYPSFESDTTWRKICIPISDFVGTDSNPQVDLSIMKVLCSIASSERSGGTGGTRQTFWIDDIRWEKKCE